MAGKIPQTFIDDLLERTDIVELIDSRVKLKKTGRNYSACCPFHDEKTPSFSVNPDKQFYYCFGCGAGGNAISFLMDYDRADFIETIESLARHQGMEIPREQHNEAAERQQKAKRSIYDLLAQANQFYQSQLRHHPNKMLAIDYLKQRGLSGEIAKQFEIGFAPAGWDNLLLELGNNEEQKQLLIDGGMLIEKDNGKGCYDRFRERLIFPIRDSRGRTIAFGGRVFNDDKPKYLNSPETPVFHKQHELYGLYEARQSNRHLQRLIMVEGYMDVVALAQFGITYAVATLGTAAGTSHMEKVFRQCSEVIFCFDGDDAGRKAADRALEAVIPLMQAGRQAKFLFLPQGEDPDSHIRNIGQEQFVHQMDTALSLSEYLFQQGSENLDLSRADDKASLVNRLIPQIKAMPQGTYQELILRSLSEKSGLPIDDIKQLESVNQPEPPPYADQRQANNSSNQNPYSDEQETAFYDDSAYHEHFYNDTNQPYSSNHDQKGSSKNKNKGNWHKNSDWKNNPDGPKQRDKIPPSQRKVKRTPIRTAISLLLFQPELKQHINDELNLSTDNNDEQLLSQIIQSIKDNPDFQAAALLGYWLAKESEKITPLLAIEHSNDDPDAKSLEFKEALQQIINNQQRQLNQDSLQQWKHQNSDSNTSFDSEKEKAKQLMDAIRKMKEKPPIH